ncbi:MAG: type II secretion system protein [Pseudomonadota bacterium]
MKLVMQNRGRGFTLVEMAIVLVIVGLLLSGMLITLSAQRDLRAYNDTQKQMADLVEALIGFAASHPANDQKPYLPCPDTDDDGLENRVVATGVCVQPEGGIPWATLGLGQEDAWGNRFRYRVDLNYANSVAGFTLATPDSPLAVCSADTGCGLNLANSTPAIIVSHGKNGFGASNSSGGTNPVPTAPGEVENRDGDTDFVFHPPSAAAATEFDDLVVWLPAGILMNRMISAGLF